MTQTLWEWQRREKSIFRACRLALTRQSFTHLYTALAEILDNALKHETFHIFVDLLADADRHFLFLTASNQNNKVIALDDRQLRYPELMARLTTKLPPGGYGMNVIENSLRRIGAQYQPVKWSDTNYNFYRRRDGRTLNCFWSALVFPKKSGLIIAPESEHATF